jgi:imidazole glycerol-phosphate synthase subunit HisH
MKSNKKKVAIIDYGLGNLFSVKSACLAVEMDAEITHSHQAIQKADLIILPGVGAFGNAMHQLKKLNLISILKDCAASGKPMVGICLGMQLLMTESEEFGNHKGLGIIEGSVVRFNAPRDGNRNLKIPQVGWNQISAPNGKSSEEIWEKTPLKGLKEKEYMYFVHSLHVKPKNPKVILASTRYGNIKFCSSMKYRNIFASQFHPERSGVEGLKIYKNLASLIHNQKEHRS